MNSSYSSTRITSDKTTTTKQIHAPELSLWVQRVSGFSLLITNICVPKFTGTVETEKGFLHAPSAPHLAKTFFSDFSTVPFKLKISIPYCKKYRWVAVTIIFQTITLKTFNTPHKTRPIIKPLKIRTFRGQSQIALLDCLQYSITI